MKHKSLVAKMAGGCIAVLVMWMTFPAAQAQTPAPAAVPAIAGRPDADTSSDPLLGAKFESVMQGISFFGPADYTKLERRAEDEVAEFVNEKTSSSLRVTMATRDTPTKLGPTKKQGQPDEPGLLSRAVDALKASIPEAQILRSDVINVGEFWVGMIVLRYNMGSHTFLRQQALLQANDYLFYVFNMITPAGKEVGDATDARAVQTFNALLDSVRLIDRSSIKYDQNERLLRTRALFVDWTNQRLTSALIPKQWFRVLKDGKDIGWRYVEEMTGRQRRSMAGILKPDGTRIADDGLVSDDGLVVYVHSWTKVEPDKTKEKDLDANDQAMDVGAEMVVTFDRTHERWAQVSGFWAQKKIKNTTTELGESRRMVKRIYLLKENVPGVADPEDKSPKAPRYRPADVYKLEVQWMGKQTNLTPVRRELPPYYLPQALGHLLPRLVPLREPRTLLFATYVGDRREVMMRYVDIMRETTVTLGGETYKTIPVVDRIGLEGIPTIHYMGLDGKFIGSTNKATGITVLATDGPSLQKLWPDAELHVDTIDAPAEIRPMPAETPDNDPRGGFQLPKRVP